MEFADRLGLAALVVTVCGLGITILWPTRRWIGWLCLGAGVLLAAWWGRLEYVAAHRPKIEQQAEKTKTKQLRPYCFVKPVFGAGPNLVSLAMNNATNSSVQVARLMMTEINENEPASLIQDCPVGPVVPNQKLFPLPPCKSQFLVSKDTTKWQFEIKSTDDIFMEYVTIHRMGENLQATCELSSYSWNTKIMNGKCP